MFEAAGSDTRVAIDPIETKARGFHADALDLLKAHSVGDTPDFAVAAHEWIGSFVEAGYAANLEGYIAANSGFTPIRRDVLSLTRHETWVWASWATRRHATHRSFVT